MKVNICPRCRNRRFYRVRRGKIRCKNCLYEFKPYPVRGVRLDERSIKQLITWFLLERGGLWVAKKESLGKNLIYKVFSLIRSACLRDIPEQFCGIVEVDETYLGGQKRNKSKSQLKKEEIAYGESRRGFGTTKQPVFGILCRNGKVWASVVDDTEAKDLIPIIEKRVKPGTKICSDTWRAYTGLATRGYVHRTVEHQKKEYVKGKNHINGLEGFFGYLKRKLASKGGVRRKYLCLFLGEYVWRYNHRNLEFRDQIERIFHLISEFSG